MTPRSTIVTTADDRFALPATVMMRSVVDHLAGTAAIDFFVLDCGLSAKSRWKMRRSIPRNWARLRFISISSDDLTGFRVDGHIPAAAYARLFMGKLLPEGIDRVLYLDGDMVALTDVAPLAAMDLKGHPVAAVQDPLAGRVGQSPMLMHWQDWDVPAGTSAFNSGLMVMDLPRWRSEGTFERAIRVAREHPERMLWHDQSALNYVIRGDYEPLDPVWNPLPQFYSPQGIDGVIYDKETVDRCIQDPKMLHFGGTWRPWKGSGRHGRETEFYRYLHRTAWRNDVFCAPWMGSGKTGWTKISRRLRQMASGGSKRATAERA